MTDKEFDHYLQDPVDEKYFSLRSIAYYYEQMEEKEKVVKELAKRIVGYDSTLSGSLTEIEKKVAQRFAEWDGKLQTFPDSVETLLSEWVDDGTLNHVIDTSLIEEKVAPVIALLAEKAHESDLEIERQRISNLTANAGDTDGNAELLDIRVGFDGVTYATAGEATRALSNYMVEDGQIWEVE